MLTFALNSGKVSVSFNVACKTVFQRIGFFLEIEKFVNFIVDKGNYDCRYFWNLSDNYD